MVIDDRTNTAGSRPARPVLFSGDRDGGGLSDLLGPESLRTSFQRIIDLQTDAIVGYEAVVRGPADSSFADPVSLASAAKSMGMTPDLDAARWNGALGEAARADLPRELPLFIAVDPDSLTELPDLRDHDMGGAVLQFDETALIRRPAHLMQVVAEVRRLGWAIAVDHVGVRPESLALLPLLEPDVIKLDRTLLATRPNRFTARVVNAVAAQVERTGAVVMAEGIDTPRAALTAQAMGARVGEGSLYGSTTDLSVDSPVGSPLEFEIARDRGFTPMSTPYNLAAGGRDVRRASKRLLIEISKNLEAMATDSQQTALMLGAFQHVKHFTPITGRRWELMAMNATLVGALAENIGTEPAPKIRGANLAASDALREEWDVVVLTPHFSAVLAARDLGDTGPDMERRYDYVLSHDTTLTIECARSLIARLPPERSGSW
ncbi:MULTISPECIES: EAL domain-containing protein [Nocardiaceae]|uniref:EAL domain-containing protein (Putative c-di-GMP-specific phosphodiesterase class I) n=1 Tax=Rhodococcoides corynebacterioides TaxID=53972 RepID=A0ABS2KX32_9NOCA|nr:MULTISPECIES: EAL domain-containing protein [Rhodococcus]MBM7416500.1 EAL domain-containing protein (putative c-di-GMP-specific phosphodiesterase class I) [Rhodococcus corynebacterioides]MBP1114753.1 EAL domain-containing protein (putative c-di-GMP-specific phosphodiesterase class I) [Rhodococcus sp. PvP016]